MHYNQHYRKKKLTSKGKVLAACGLGFLSITFIIVAAFYTVDFDQAKATLGISEKQEVSSTKSFVQSEQSKF